MTENSNNANPDNQHLLTLAEKKKAIDKWLDKMMINNYTINDDLTIDVDGTVNLDGKGLDSLPYKFGYVKDYFTCERNALQDMTNMPHTVGKDWHVSDNNIVSLVGMPKVLGKTINFKHNQVTSFEGIAPDFKETIDARDNHLKTLDNLPLSFGSLLCEDNPFEFTNRIIHHLPRLKENLACNGEFFNTLMLPENRHWIVPEQIGGILFVQSSARGSMLDMFCDFQNNIRMPWKDVCRYLLMTKLDNEINDDNSGKIERHIKI